MLISVTDEGGLLDSKTREMAERRLLFALSRYDSIISRVEMSISGDHTSGTADPSGGHAKVCRVLVTFSRRDELKASDRDDDLAQCISRVADRVGREVGRAVEQMHRLGGLRARN